MIIKISKSDLEDINSFLLPDNPLSMKKANELMNKNPLIFYEGKKWGFSDSVVRDSIVIELIKIGFKVND